jgi:hypothetical protein
MILREITPQIEPKKAFILQGDANGTSRETAPESIQQGYSSSDAS